MELANVLISVIAVIVSSVAILVSTRISSIANDFSKTAMMAQKGQTEIMVREMISTAIRHYDDMAIKTESTPTEINAELLNSALEGVCNAYDEACSKYIDGKVDRERFKKLYCDEIRQWVENKSNVDKYHEPQTKYKATAKVYKEWNDLEK